MPISRLIEPKRSSSQQVGARLQCAIGKVVAMATGIVAAFGVVRYFG